VSCFTCVKDKKEILMSWRDGDRVVLEICVDCAKQILVWLYRESKEEPF